MPDINILSPHLADLIAAGEVVERPASVVKELVENSFDAKAKNVTVEIRDGGLTFIRITDDGVGMLPEDAGVCFLRHATSKLSAEEDLNRIGTMGFRGEALAAISAVSDIELLTRKRGSGTGTRALVSAGDITDMTPWGCPEGTSITVSGLFRNTPARLKFLKSDKSEGTACALAALRCALGRPEVSVRLIRDGREEFFSPGDGRESSCVYSLLGREMAASLLPCSGKDELVSLSGFVGSPSAGQGSRAKQFFFCNGRCIRSALLQAAVEQAYKNTLLTGRFPACVLWLEISPSAVDVNVHPAKTEVRFRDEKKVFDSVYYAARAALENEAGRREIKLEKQKPAKSASAAPSGDFFKSMSSSEFLKSQGAGQGKVPTSAAPAAERRTAAVYSRPAGGSSLYSDRPVRDKPAFGQSTLLRSPAPVYNGVPVPASPSYGDAERRAEPVQSKMPEPPVHAPKEKETAAPVPDVTEAAEDFRIVGEAMKTYIVAERGQELIFIDKHAAHERMIFDRLKSQDRELMSQALLEPVIIKADAQDVELVEENEELLSRLGFELEAYGEGSLILRSLPADTDAADAPALVEELCEKLRKHTRLSPQDAVDEILHTVACKAAIKAGRSADSDELYLVARAVLSGQVKYCPHGRPVSITLTKKQLDKEFSRIV